MPSESSFLDMITQQAGIDNKISFTSAVQMATGTSDEVQSGNPFSAQDEMSTIGTTPAQDSSSIFTSSQIANIYLCIGSIGIIGNFLVITIMLSSATLRKKLSSVYLVNQSISDFLVSVILVASADLTNAVPYEGAAGTAYCVVWQTRVLLWAFLNVSTYNFVFLTIERYFAVVHPIWYKVHYGKKQVTISLFLIYVVGFVYEAICKIPTSYVENQQCMFMRRWPSQVARKFYGFTVVIIKFFLPLLVLTFAYSRIAYVLHRRIKDNATGKDEKLQRGKRNTIKTLAIVALCFISCWVCNQLNFFLFNAGFNINLYSDFSHITIIMIYVNSIINPFIYSIKYEHFQQAAKTLLFRILRRPLTNKVGPGTSITASVNASGAAPDAQVSHIQIPPNMPRPE